VLERIRNPCLRYSAVGLPLTGHSYRGGCKRTVSKLELVSLIITLRANKLRTAVYCNRPCLFICFLFVCLWVRLFNYYSQRAVFASPVSAFHFFLVRICLRLRTHYVFEFMTANTVKLYISLLQIDFDILRRKELFPTDIVRLYFLPRDAMRKRGMLIGVRPSICPSVYPSVCYVHVLYPDGLRYRQTSFSAQMHVSRAENGAERAETRVSKSRHSRKRLSGSGEQSGRPRSWSGAESGLNRQLKISSQTRTMS